MQDTQYIEVIQFDFLWAKQAPVDEVLRAARRVSSTPIVPSTGYVVFKLSGGALQVHASRFDSSD